MLRAAKGINASFSLTLLLPLLLLELFYCILLVQGRYSSVLLFKVFAPTADSDATTLLRIKSNTYCSVSVRLSNTSLSLSRYSYLPYVCFSWLLLRCALTANLTVHLPRGLVTYLSTLAYTPMCIRSEIVHYITCLTLHSGRLVTAAWLHYIHVRFQINGRIRYLL